MNKMINLWVITWYVGLVVMTSCQAPSEQKQEEMVAIKEMMASAPEYEDYECELSNAMLINYGSWKMAEVDEIYWAVERWPIMADTTYIITNIRTALAEWEQEMGIPVRMTRDKAKANIVFRFAPYDGIGKKAGVSESPPMSNTDRKQIYITMDEYDFQAHRPDYDFFTNLLHETGHAVGLLHSEDPSSVMYYKPSGVKKKITIDDAAAIRLRYDRKVDFRFQGVNYIAIHKHGNRMVSKNFSEKELWTTCNNYHYDTHWIAQPCITGLQIIRDYVGVPMRVNSSYRNHTCNVVKGGATLSQHIYMSAVDFIFIKNPWNARARYEKEVISKSPLFKSLYDAGIRGFGSYANGSFHIDCRRTHYCDWWYGQPYCAWGRFNTHFGVPIDEEITQD